MFRIDDRFREEETVPEFEGSTCAAQERGYVANVYDMFLCGF